MATWTFANGDGVITGTRDSTSFTISKEYPVIMEVSGNTLSLFYSFPVAQGYALQSSSQTPPLNRRTYEIIYSDVTSPTVASATALKTLIQSWLDSTDPFIIPVASKTIVDNTIHQTYGSYQITGSLSLTINGTGKLVIQ